MPLTTTVSEKIVSMGPGHVPSRYCPSWHELVQFWHTRLAVTLQACAWNCDAPHVVQLVHVELLLLVQVPARKLPCAQSAVVSHRVHALFCVGVHWPVR